MPWPNSCSKAKARIVIDGNGAHAGDDEADVTLTATRRGLRADPRRRSQPDRGLHDRQARRRRRHGRGDAPRRAALLSAHGPRRFTTTWPTRPAGGEAWWLTTSDGARIRVAAWPAGTRHAGARHRAPVPRPHRIRREIRPRRADTTPRAASPCWSSTGAARASPPAPCPTAGSAMSTDFAEYQRDRRRRRSTSRAGSSLPEPWFLRRPIRWAAASACGPCTQGLPVRAAAFSAPMWGIQMAAWEVPARLGQRASRAAARPRRPPHPPHQPRPPRCWPAPSRATI